MDTNVKKPVGKLTGHTYLWLLSIGVAFVIGTNVGRCGGYIPVPGAASTYQPAVTTQQSYTPLDQIVDDLVAESWAEPSVQSPAAVTDHLERNGWGMVLFYSS